MNLYDYNYNLPVEMIAQKPAEIRDKARLMVLDIIRDTISHRVFNELYSFFNEDDLLVINDTKVFPARLIGKKQETGGEVEIFLLRSYKDGTWDTLSRPSKRLKEGSLINFDGGFLRAEVVKKGLDGHVCVHFKSEHDIDTAIDMLGKIPLPPYIKREPDETDRERYQTVYAQKRGAVAAPTAGLHFTEKMLNKLESKGIKKASVTLHVGIGTFRPLREDEAKSDKLHSEYCIVPQSTVNKVIECHRKGGRIIAVGTTTARALESASITGEIKTYEGWTDIFIKPPYMFRSVDTLITNFHLPRSSLLMMVCAFAGREKILNAYNEAIREGYRFYSYGDSMLIIGSGH